jgi:hypothetical protein
MSTPPTTTGQRSATASPRSPARSPRSGTRSPQSPGPTSPAAAPQPSNLSTVILADNANNDVEAESDEDSTYGSEASSSYSASITSSIRDHVHENGLRYHAFKQDVNYPFPNDENEQNRDDIKHAMTVMLCGGKLHFAPIGENPQAILDLG